MDSASNGNRIMGLDDGSITNEKSRRHPRWTRQENLTLIQAKDITENTPNKGRKIRSALLGSAAGGGSSSLLFDNTEPKWVMISSYCKQQGVKRGPAQCRKRWSNLLGDFKKVKAWESNLEDKADSFWTMRNDLRKERKLPVSFDIEVFKVLEGRETGAVSPLPLQAVAAATATATAAVSDDVPVSFDIEVFKVLEGREIGAVSPLPLQAIAAATATATAAVSDDVNEFGDECLEEEEIEEEDEQMLNGGEILSDLKDEGQETPAFEWKSEDIKSADNVTESPVKNFCIPEPISDASKESWAGIINWDSQEKGKRRRFSTDDHKANCSEAQILRMLEANNKLLNAQLESHNKNWQLDREQRKENNNELMATLSKLKDVLIKIAEKL